MKRYVRELANDVAKEIKEDSVASKDVKETFLWNIQRTVSYCERELLTTFDAVKDLTGTLETFHNMPV